MRRQVELVHHQGARHATGLLKQDGGWLCLRAEWAAVHLGSAEKEKGYENENENGFLPERICSLELVLFCGMNWRPLPSLAPPYAPESAPVSSSIGMRPQGTSVLLGLVLRAYPATMPLLARNFLSVEAGCYSAKLASKLDT
jgi:hypothetical protein